MELSLEKGFIALSDADSICRWPGKLSGRPFNGNDTMSIFRRIKDAIFGSAAAQ